MLPVTPRRRESAFLCLLHSNARIMLPHTEVENIAFSRLISCFNAELNDAIPADAEIIGHADSFL